MRMNEDDLLSEVLRKAAGLGWATFHARPARTEAGWRTPGSGTLAKGFPDLVAFHPEHGILVAELKSEKGRMRPEQVEARHAIEAAMTAVARAGATLYDPTHQGPANVLRRLRYRIWRPIDLDDGTIERELRGAK